MRKRRRVDQRKSPVQTSAQVKTSSFNETKLHQDYAATASDAGVLKRPLKEELKPHEVKNVFGFPRSLREK